MSSSFVFLICTERSGSNFITSLLNGHSRISGPPPSHLFRLFATNRGNYGQLTSEPSWNTLVEDVIQNFECKLGNWSTSVTAEELKRDAARRSIAEILRLVYEKEARHDGADYIFVKENHTYSFAPFLLAHFPNCRFVWMVRDPRDVASSWVSTRSIPGGVADAVEVWTKDQKASLDLFQQMRDSGRILLVRYEDLVRDTHAALSRLTDFLELSFEDGMLEFYKASRTAANATRIDAWANLGRPVLQDNTGKYRQTLSPADLRYVELACFDLMARVGYACELVTEPPDDERLAAELETLRSSVSAGGYDIPSEEERRIRSRRLAAINQVLDRKLWQGDEQTSRYEHGPDSPPGSASGVLGGGAGLRE